MKKAELSVYEILRKKILNLEFTPGQELDLKELSEQLEISRSPLRDALLRLELDKLVDIFPQKGTRVSLLDRKIIQQERFMRINLELGVLMQLKEKLSSENARNIFTTKMQSVYLQQKACLLDDNKTKFLKFDDDLHYLFYEETDNQWIWDVINRHTGNDHRIRMLSYNAQKIADVVELEHRNLIESISSADFEQVIKIDKAHLDRVFSEFEPLEKNYPEYFTE